MISHQEDIKDQLTRSSGSRCGSRVGPAGRTRTSHDWLLVEAPGFRCPVWSDDDTSVFFELPTIQCVGSCCTYLPGVAAISWCVPQGMYDEVSRSRSLHLTSASPHSHLKADRYRVQYRQQVYRHPRCGQVGGGPVGSLSADPDTYIGTTYSNMREAYCRPDRPSSTISIHLPTILRQSVRIINRYST